MSRLFRSVVAVGVVGLAAGSSFGVLIKNGSGTTLFYDNFEGASASAAAYPDASGDYDPVATTGTWTISEPATTTVQVTSYGTPGASEGNQYLRSTRATSGFNAFAGFGAQTGGTLHAEFMYYAVNSASFPEKANASQISLVNSTGPSFPTSYRFLLDNHSADHHIYQYDGTKDVDTGVAYTPNQWQKWIIDVDLTAHTYTFSVDGNSSATIPFLTAGNDAAALLFNSGNNNVQFMVDAVAVPEPATLGLAGLAGLMLAARRRRV